LLKDQAKTNYIEVCAQKCLFSQSDSTATVAKCKLPKISTTYSNQNFKIEESSDDLNSRNYFGTAEDNSMYFDNSLLFTPSNQNDLCYFGMEFKEGHVAMISQVKFFMGNIVDKNVFINKTKFQGSQDGESYTDIFDIDDNIHEGWNYHKWE
jgi:hypothetical protein